MYIKKVVLENVRCFEYLEIDFDEIGSSVLFLGDNGDGKSTILKSIAMGLCDESSASALFREQQGDFVRRRPGKKESTTNDKARIIIDLVGDDDFTHQIITTITSLDKFERVSQSNPFKEKGKGLSKFKAKSKPIQLNQDSFPWQQIFVSGYGAGVRVQGTADFQHYLAVDAVYPLFKYDEPLQNPELVIRRLVEAAQGTRKDPEIKTEQAEAILTKVKKLLKDLLELKSEKDIELTSTGVRVKGRWGSAELGELGDGYRAMITWVMDLIAWWFLKTTQKSRINLSSIKGIVIFDEIEQHLHPRWQRYVLSYIKKAFPKIQFIATTHSPLCAAGTADFDEGTFQLINIFSSNGKSTAERIQHVKGLRADQILTSKAFNLPETRNPEVGNNVERFRELALKPKLTSPEKKELRKLRKFVMENVPEAGQFEEERRISNELRELMKEVEGQIKSKRKK